MALNLRSVVQEWGIQDKLVAITTDNTRNIVNDFEIQLQWHQLPCAVQLGVRAGLAIEPVSAVLTRCRKLVGHFKHSTVAHNARNRKGSVCQNMSCSNQLLPDGIAPLKCLSVLMSSKLLFRHYCWEAKRLQIGT